MTMVYLCGSCYALLRITKGTTLVMSMSLCTVCGYDYFHEDFENAEEDYSHMWVDIGGES